MKAPYVWNDSDTWMANSRVGVSTSIWGLAMDGSIRDSSGKAKGDLALDWRGGWMAGGDSGPVIKLGKPAESFLL